MREGIPIPETPKSDAEVVEELNNRIAKLRMYGLREVAVDKPSYILTWSNASKEWWPSYGLGVIQPGQTISLDANQTLAPYRKAVLERVLPHLDYLPLYKMSFEAKVRGEYATD